MSNPLVSIIIPSYNHAEYLPKAFNSIKNQTYSNIEIILMDDGSTDHTKEVISQYDDIQYIYQENAGLSAARNNAILHTNGEYILFLDADDWLYPEALNSHISYFLQDPDLYFVSGSHMKVFVEENKFFQNGAYDISENNFVSILQHHYISHPAAVLFHRKTFDLYRFDDNFKSCQDYDIYLTIARNHKVLHHSNLVSAYRQHSSNMSSNHANMLKEILLVLEKHRPFLKSEEEYQGYEKGKKKFVDFYTKALYYEKIRRYKVKATKDEKNLLRMYNPQLYMRYVGNIILNR